MFIIHENFNTSHDYTRIHIDECSFVTRRKSDHTENTNWYYPYFEYKNVLQIANSLGRTKGPFNCKFCRPENYAEHSTMSSTLSNYPTSLNDSLRSTQ